MADPGEISVPDVVAPNSAASQLLALQNALRTAGDVGTGDIIPEDVRKVQPGAVYSSYDDELIERVVYALVHAELEAEESGEAGLTFRSTEKALEECGVPFAQFVQMSGTDRFKKAHRRVARTFFVDLRYGRMMKAASNAAMNGDQRALKMVLDGDEEETDAVKAKLEEVEVGGERAFYATVNELRERLRRLTDRVEVRQATDEQVGAARGTASERESEERAVADVDHRAATRGDPG